MNNFKHPLVWQLIFRFPRGLKHHSDFMKIFNFFNSTVKTVNFSVNTRIRLYRTVFKMKDPDENS